MEWFIILLSSLYSLASRDNYDTEVRVVSSGRVQVVSGMMYDVAYDALQVRVPGTNTACSMSNMLLQTQQRLVQKDKRKSKGGSNMQDKLRPTEVQEVNSVATYR
jgi:hypothetical protein